MGKKKKVKISQVFDPNLIPDSYVRNNKNQDRGHLFANYVGKEIHAGRALAILFGGNAETGSGHGGAFYVHPEHMLRMQQEFDAKQLAVGCEDNDSSGPTDSVQLLDKSQAESAVIALCEIKNGITLIQATLERLTLAVEIMATQPQTPHDRLVATVESNGFHN